MAGGFKLAVSAFGSTHTHWLSHLFICKPVALPIDATVGSKSTLSWDVPLALFDTAPFSAAIPLSGDDGSYIFVNTGLPAAGAAGGGAGSGAEGLLKKNIGYSPNCEEDCSSKIFCRNSTTERCPPRHIRSACVSDNSGDLLGKR